MAGGETHPHGLVFVWREGRPLPYGFVFVWREGKPLPYSYRSKPVYYLLEIFAAGGKILERVKTCTSG